MRDDCSEPSQVSNRILGGQFAKPLQLSDELQYRFLLQVVGFGALRFAMRS